MENKKNKKKLFAIIGASALAFILTVALSVSITLAYFGQAGSGNATIKTGGSVLVNTAVTDTTSLAGLIPGQKITLDMKANVTSSSTQDAYLVAVIGTDGEGDDLAGLVTGSLATGWVKVGTATGTHAGDVYLYGISADSATKIVATTSQQNIALTTGIVNVPTNWTNEKADQTVKLTVTFVAIQAPVDNNGTPMTAVKYADMLDILGSVDTGTTFAVTA